MNFESLIDKFQDDVLSPQELSEFNRLLRDPGNRQRLREALWFEAALLEAARQTSVETTGQLSAAPEPVAGGKSKPIAIVTRQTQLPVAGRMAALATLAAVGLVACVLLWPFAGPARRAVPSKPPAVVASAEDTSIEDESAALDWKSPELSADGQVTIRFHAPQANEVWLGGEVVGPRGERPMVRDAAGLWSVTVGPLAPELYTYSLRVDGTAVLDPLNRAVVTGRAPRNLVLVPAAEKLFHEERSVPHGALHFQTYGGPENTERPVVVYTPPGYEAKAATRYPVLYLLHGAFDDETAWTTTGRANCILDNLLAEHAARPMLVVMPRSTGGVRGAPGLAALEQDAADFLVPFIDQQYRTLPDRDHRAVAGLSSGGRATLHLAMQRPDLFGWAGAFSPTTAGLMVPAGLGAGLAPRWNLLWLSGGARDPRVGQVLAFQEALHGAGVPHEWRLNEGDHTWQLWRRDLRDFVKLIFAP